MQYLGNGDVRNTANYSHLVREREITDNLSFDGRGNPASSDTRYFIVKNGEDGFVDGQKSAGIVDAAEFEFGYGVEKKNTQYTVDNLAEKSTLERYLLITGTNGEKQKRYVGGELQENEYSANGNLLQNKVLLYSLDYSQTDASGSPLRKNEIIRVTVNDPKRIDLFGNVHFSTFSEYKVLEGKTGLDGENIDITQAKLSGGRIRVDSKFIVGGRAKESDVYKFVVDEAGKSVFTSGAMTSKEFEYNLDGQVVFSREANFRLDDNSAQINGIDLSDFTKVSDLLKNEQEQEIKERLLLKSVTDTYSGQYDGLGNAGFSEIREYSISPDAANRGFDPVTNKIDINQFVWESGELQDNRKFSATGQPLEQLIYAYRRVEDEKTGKMLNWFVE
jgi:hypothetical protein